MLSCDALRWAGVCPAASSLGDAGVHSSRDRATALGSFQAGRVVFLPVFKSGCITFSYWLVGHSECEFLVRSVTNNVSQTLGLPIYFLNNVS